MIHRDRILGATGGEIVTLDAARRQLGLYEADDDDRVTLMLEAARDYCENWSETTLQVGRRRARDYSAWPASPVALPWPPVLSVDEVRYIDAYDQPQVVDLTEYRVQTTSGGVAYLEWAETFTRPSVAARQDAVTIEFNTGYQSPSLAPPSAAAAILLTMAAIEGREEPGWMEQARQTALRLLAGASHPSYQ